MDTLGSSGFEDVEMADRRSGNQEQYNFFDAALSSVQQPYTPSTERFAKFQSFAGSYLQNEGGLFDESMSDSNYDEYMNMIHREFPSDDDLCKFFEYVEILFPNYKKRYTIRTNDGVRWSVWYHENSKSVCFLSLENSDLSDTPYNSVQSNPVNRIRLKKSFGDHNNNSNRGGSNESTDLENKMMQSVIPMPTATSPSDGGSGSSKVSDDSEKVEYFENNRQISEGLPGALVDILFSKLYSNILKYIYSEKSANTLGKSGILTFFLRCLVNIPEKRVENSLFVDTREDEHGRTLIYSLGHQINVGGTPFNNGNPILIIYEKVEQESLFIGADNETVQILKYKLTFAKELFPENPRLINVETVEMLEPGERHMVTRELSPNSMKRNFLGDRNSSTTMVNFLEYFLHKYLAYWGVRTEYDIPPQDHYAEIGCFYHPLAMEKVPWEVLDVYISACRTLPIFDFVQVGALKDDLSMGDAVDAGGPTKTFIEQLARQIFRCQEKRLLLHSLAHPINHNFSSRISMYSPDVLFPVFYHVNTPYAKDNVVYKILFFLRQVYVMEKKIPPLINPLFFYYFLESKAGFSDRELVYFLQWNFLHDVKERKKIIESTEASKFDVRSAENFVHYYHHLLIDLVIRVHENDEDSEKNPVLYFALFLRNYFVPKKNPRNLNECFRFVLGDFWSDRAKRVAFYNDMQIIFGKYFELQLWNYDDEAPTTTSITSANIRFPEEEEDDAGEPGNDDEMSDRVRFFYLKTKYNENFKDKKKLSLPKGNEVIYLARKLIQVLKEAYDPIIEFIFYFRQKYDALSHVFEENLLWDKIFAENGEGPGFGLAASLLGSTSRELIARGIVYHDSNGGDAVPPPLVLQKIEWLKEHILDHSTSEAWVEGFVRAVTGTSTFSDEIKVNGVEFHANRYCTAHTCFNLLDVSLNTNECPGISEASDVRRQMSEKEVFIKNLTDGLLASQHEALLA